VLTALIQHEASPDTVARKQAAGSAKPLAPELALKTPATNVYPSQSAAPPPPANAPTAEAPPPVYVNPPLDYAETAPASPPASVTYFYSALAPYGSWVQVPSYGLCWRPTVAVINPYWRPYADHGRWLWSDCGWYWYSDYTWGWAPFHYGRWTSPPGLGWVWVPDTTWGPAWVTWRHTRFHCGWAPLPPRCHYVSGLGLYYHNNSVSVSFDFGFGADYYTFLPLTRFCDRTPYFYYLPASQAVTVYRDSTVVNNYTTVNHTVINHGIGFERVARVTRDEIRKVTVEIEPLPRPRAAIRPERLVGDGGSVVVRPRLPEGSPSAPVAVPTRPRDEIPKAPVAGASAAVAAPAAEGSAKSERPLAGARPALAARPFAPATPAARRDEVVVGSGNSPAASAAPAARGRDEAPKLFQPPAAASGPARANRPVLTAPTAQGAAPGTIRSRREAEQPKPYVFAPATVSDRGNERKAPHPGNAFSPAAPGVPSPAFSPRPLVSTTPAAPRPIAPAVSAPLSVPTPVAPPPLSTAPPRPVVSSPAPFAPVRVPAPAPSSRPAITRTELPRSYSVPTPSLPRPSAPPVSAPAPRPIAPIPLPAATPRLEAPRPVAPVAPAAPAPRPVAPPAAASAPAPAPPIAAPAPRPSFSGPAAPAHGRRDAEARK
jgi:hypothetical protein